jgi:DNA-binding NarL/FixJ family response regulator
MKVHRIILADDHSMFRAGLRTLIEKNERFCVIDEACDGEDLLKKLKGSRCDLVVMDVSMPKMSGITALKQVIKKYPRIKVLVLTMHKDTQYFHRAMADGASGYLLKDDAFEQLVKAMDMVLSGNQFISPGILTLVEEQQGAVAKEKKSDMKIDLLSKREQQVLRLVAAGLANKNIAHQLGISVRTVEAHRLNFMKKLGIKTTAGLVRYAMEISFVE